MHTWYLVFKCKPQMNITIGCSATIFVILLQQFLCIVVQKNSPFGVFPSDKNKILQISTLEKLYQCCAFLCFTAIECSANSSTSSGRKHMVWSKRPLTTVPVSDIAMFTGKKKSIQSGTRQRFVLMDLSVTMRGVSGQLIL